MKFKLDENIPVALARVLGGLGHDVDTVPEEDLTGSSDGDVWARTQEAERLLITQDLDFADARRFAPGTHNGILLIRLGNPSRREWRAKSSPPIFKDQESTMVEPMTREEAERMLREAVARARRNPPRLENVAPPINAAELRKLCTGPIYEGFEEDIKRMRRGLEPLGPRE